jgi:hypothetical protein
MRPSITISDILDPRKHLFIKAQLKIRKERYVKEDLLDLITRFNPTYYRFTIHPHRRSEIVDKLAYCRPDLSRYAIRKALTKAYSKHQLRVMRNPDRSRHQWSGVSSIPSTEKMKEKNCFKYPPNDYDSFYNHWTKTIQGFYPELMHQLKSPRLFPLKQSVYDEFAINFWEKKGCPMFQKQRLEKIVWGMPYTKRGAFNVPLPNGRSFRKSMVFARAVGVFIGKKKNGIGLIFLVD